MTRAFDALQALLEDASLREDVTDDEAKPLFDWAAEQLKRLDAENADDERFETAVGAIRRIVKSLNWVVGRRTYAGAESLTGFLGKAATAAQEAGLNPPTLPFSAQALEAREDGPALMGELLASMSGTAAQAAVGPVAAQVEQPPAAPEPQADEPENLGWLRARRWGGVFGGGGQYGQDSPDGTEEKPSDA